MLTGRQCSRTRRRRCSRTHGEGSVAGYIAGGGEVGRISVKAQLLTAKGVNFISRGVALE